MEGSELNLGSSQDIQDKIFASVQLNPQSQSQRTWYNLTDNIARYSPSVASTLDSIKEGIEEEVISRRASAIRSREIQKKIASDALEEKRRIEHQERIARLEFIRAKEEEREEQRQKEETRREEQKQARERRQLILSKTPRERHDWRRTEFTTQLSQFPQLDFSHQDLRGLQRNASDWYRANLQYCILSGIRLEGAGLIEADLNQATIDYAKLHGATLDGAKMEKVNLEGCSLQNASLIGSQLRLARLYDSDLRGADFTGSFLFGCDFTGAKATEVSFAGADLSEAVLTETDLQSSSFRGAKLTGTTFDRANLQDCDLYGANVLSADFRGVLGLSQKTLQDLEQRGAIIDLLDAADRSAAFGAPQLRVALVLFSLGMGGILLNSYFDSQIPDLTVLEERAKGLRLENPAAASIEYEQLAKQSQTLQNQVDYYIEAAALAEQANQIERSETLLDKALTAADLNTELTSKVQLRSAQFHLEHNAPEKTLEHLRVLYTNPTLSAFQRAEVIIAAESATQILGQDAEEELSSFYERISTLPEAEADLRMALADLRLQAEDNDLALLELQRAKELPLSEDLQLRLLEAEARTYDRIGNIELALEHYQNLLDRTDKTTQTSKTSLLAMADLERRQGNTDQAKEYLSTLIEESYDGRIRSRALLILGRIYEENGDITTAAETYQLSLLSEDGEPETLEEARVSLARLVLKAGDTENDLLKDLPPDILAQARLGEARSYLDDGNAEKAINIYGDVLAEIDLPAQTYRSAKSAQAEALSSLGKHQQAQEQWENLLREDLEGNERRHIETLLAYGKLQSGDIDGAQSAFQSLSKSADQETRLLGMLGLAETARSSGELERAKELYQIVINRSPEKSYILQAWQELALIANEQDRPEDQVAAWRSILQLSPEDASLRLEAHSSIANALAQLGQLDEAIAECELTSASKKTMLQCALLLEMAGDPQSFQRYVLVLEDESLGDSLRSEAALGAARTADQDSQLSYIQQGLTLSQIDPVIELQLINLALLQSASLLPEEATAYQERRNVLSTLAPDILIQSLLEITTTLRNQGDISTAIAEMEKGIQELPESEAISLVIELGDMYLETSDWDKAISTYARVLDDENIQLVYQAQHGTAIAYQGLGDIERSISAISDATPQDAVQQQQQQHLLAQLLTVSNDPEAFAAWERLGAETENPDMQYSVLLGQAQSNFAADDFTAALQFYQKAEEIAFEDSQRGWAKLGQANAHYALGEDVHSQLETLYKHPNNEVSLQARIRHAQIYIETGRIPSCLECLRWYYSCRSRSWLGYHIGRD